MANKIIELGREINSLRLTKDGSTCYAATSGSQSALIANLAISIGIYGDKDMQERVEKIFHEHLKIMKELSN